MDISETLKGTDYLMLGNNLVAESVIDSGSAKKCCLETLCISRFVLVINYIVERECTRSGNKKKRCAIRK